MIVTFLVLNLLLYLAVVKSNSPQTTMSSSEDFAAFKKVLEENDIFLSTSLPQKAPMLPLVKVKRQVFDDNFVTDFFLKNISYERTGQKGEAIFKSDKILIKISTFEFFFRETDEKFKSMSSEDKEKYIKNFLEKHSLTEEDAKLVKTDKNKNKVLLKYKQFYKDYFIDDSFIEAEISENEFTVHKKWFESVIPEKDRKEIVSSIFAVLKLVEIKEEGIHLDVENVSLGYYFNWPNALKGEAVPVWKVITNKGTYYINAYTGNLEKGE
jgi:regulatory protein YycI of two-component signal transduction system YycFG